MTPQGRRYLGQQAVKWGGRIGRSYASGKATAFGKKYIHSKLRNYRSSSSNKNKSKTSYYNRKSRRKFRANRRRRKK